MTKTHYVPRPGSLPSRLMAHLQRHPADAFTTGEVAKTFGGRATAMQTALAAAVAAKLLSRTPSGGPRGQYHYNAGPALAKFDLTAMPKASTPQKDKAPAHARAEMALRHCGTYCAVSDTLALNAAQRQTLCMVIGGIAISAATAAYMAMSDQA